MFLPFLIGVSLTLIPVWPLPTNFDWPLPTNYAQARLSESKCYKGQRPKRNSHPSRIHTCIHQRQRNVTLARVETKVFLEQIASFCSPFDHIRNRFRRLLDRQRSQLKKGKSSHHLSGCSDI